MTATTINDAPSSRPGKQPLLQERIRMNRTMTTPHPATLPRSEGQIALLRSAIRGRRKDVLRFPLISWTTGPRERPTGIKAFKFAETCDGRSNPINGCRIRRLLEHRVELFNLGSDTLQAAGDVAIIRAFILRFRLCGRLDGSAVGFLD